MKNEIKYYIFNVIIFTSWPFLSFAASNLYDFLNYTFLFYLWAICAVLLLLLLFTFQIFIKNPKFLRRAVNALCVAFALFFVYGALDQLLKGQFDVERARYVLLVWGAVFSVCLAGIWFLSKFVQTTIALAAASLAMVILPVAEIGSHFLFSRGSNTTGAALDDYVTLAEGQILPNVYWFIFDGYSRADVLESDLNFDNGPFLRELELLGFQVLERSYANYPMTHLSLATTLNMDYLVGTSPDALRNFVEFQPILAGYNNTVRMFKSMDYTYTHVQPGLWTGTSCQGAEDICIRAKREGIGETEIAILAMTPTDILLQYLIDAELLNLDFLRPKWILFPEVIEQVLKVQDRVPGPMFVFAHLLYPHEPVLRADCSEQNTAVLLRLWETQPDSMKNAYVDTIRCLNRQLLAKLPALLKRNPNAIVIIQSDHGFGQSDFFEQPIDKWQEAEIISRYGILNVIRAPETCRDSLYPSMTPVNTFRFVHACITGQVPAYLPDGVYLASYFSEETRLWKETTN